MPTNRSPRRGDKRAEPEEVLSSGAFPGDSCEQTWPACLGPDLPQPGTSQVFRVNLQG